MTDSPAVDGFEPSGPAEPQRQAALLALTQDDPKWGPAKGILDLGDNLRWKPDLVQPGKVLHLALTSEVPRVWLRRMRAAASAGYAVTFATTTIDMPVTTLREIQQLDARVTRIDLSRDPPLLVGYRSIADVIAKERLYLEPEALKCLAEDRLISALSATSNSDKGRWYEEALCLVFSQVAWLSVDEHAYRNASEEIDLLIGSHAVGHVAGLVGGAIVIATAKNESHATGSQTVKYLKEQMANRKGRCKLGFLCSASTISSDAHKEILRGTQSGDAVIVPVDRAALSRLIASPEDLTTNVERLIRAAIAE